MWPGVVVGPTVLLDDDRGFVHREERLLVEALVPEAAVKALAHAILPGFARINVGGGDARALEPPLDPVGDEFRPIITAQILRRAPPAHQLRDDLEDALGREGARHGDAQAFLGELVDHGQALEARAIGARIVDQVVCPDGVRPIGTRAQPGPRAQLAPGPPPRQCQAGAAPQAVHALRIDGEPAPAQQRPHPPVAVAGMGGGQALELRPRGPRRGPAAAPRRPGPSAPPAAARTPGGRTGGASSRSVPGPGGPLRAPFFCVDLFQDLELELPIGEQPLQAGILALQALEPDGLGLGEAAVFLAPPIVRVAGDPVTPYETGDRLSAQFLLAQQADDLLFVKAADPHRNAPLGHPVAYVAGPLGRKTGGTPAAAPACREFAPQCRKSTLNDGPRKS